MDEKPIDDNGVRPNAASSRTDVSGVRDAADQGNPTLRWVVMGLLAGAVTLMVVAGITLWKASTLGSEPLNRVGASRDMRSSSSSPSVSGLPALANPQRFGAYAPVGDALRPDAPRAGAETARHVDQYAGIGPPPKQAVGTSTNRTRAPASEDSTLAYGAGVAVPTTSPQHGSKEAFTVHVLGAVRRPGVYVLRRGTRNIRALLAAGGVTPDADTSTINQAALIQDGSQLIVPAEREHTEGGLSAASLPLESYDLPNGVIPLRGGRDRPVVDVEGAVRNPGVYFLRPDSSESNAIKVAGGANANANLGVIKLDRHVEDGMEIFVPARR